MKAQRKRFQSGHEVFKEYIPGYEQAESGSHDSVRWGGVRAAEALASEILRDFEERLKEKPISE
jgi:hypothetical protein